MMDISIKVASVDHDKMMDECKKLFIKAHPEFKEMVLTKKFMFNKLVTFYIENP